MKTESPFKETVRLRREVKKLEERIHSIKKASDAEQIAKGLRKMAKRGEPLEIDKLNSQCVNGYFRTSEWSSKEFDIQSHHGIIYAKMGPGIDVSVSLQDTWLSVQVSWPRNAPDKPGQSFKIDRENLVDNINRTKKFFAQFGVKVDCFPAIQEARTKAAELEDLAKLIDAFQGTVNSKHLLSACALVKSGIDNAATFHSQPIVKAM
jgi:hypothetical protein